MLTLPFSAVYTWRGARVCILNSGRIPNPRKGPRLFYLFAQAIALRLSRLTGNMLRMHFECQRISLSTSILGPRLFELVNASRNFKPVIHA